MLPDFLRIMDQLIDREVRVRVDLILCLNVGYFVEYGRVVISDKQNIELYIYLIIEVIL